MRQLQKEWKNSTNGNNLTTIFLFKQLFQDKYFFYSFRQHSNNINSFTKCLFKNANWKKMWGKFMWRKKIKTEWILRHFFYCKKVVMCLCNYFALFCKWVWRRLCFSSVFNLSHITENVLWHDKMLENALLRVFSIRLIFTAM